MSNRSFNLLPSASEIDPTYIIPVSSTNKTYKIPVASIIDWASSKDIKTNTVDYTLSNADGKAVINYSGLGSSSLIVSPNSEASIPIGTTIYISNNTLYGAINIVPGTGVVVNSALGYYVKNYGLSSLTKINVDAWILSGDLSPYEDMFFIDNKLVLPMNGENNSTVFKDLSPPTKAITNNNVQIVTSNSKFGDGSAQFANGSYLSIASSPDFYFDTTDFTIEFWTKLNSAGGNAVSHFISINNHSTFALKASSNQYFLHANGSVAVSADMPIIINEWHHIALVRYGQRLFLFINGELRGESVINATTTYGATASSKIGIADGASGEYLDGLITDLRITKGRARYTTNFVPPSEHLYTNKNTAHPTNVSGLRLWLDASDSSVLYDAFTGGLLSGSDASVLRWEDKSGNNFHAQQSVSANAPIKKNDIINNQNALYFDGNHYIDIPTLSISQRMTVFVVWRPNTTTSYAFDCMPNDLISRVAIFNDGGLTATAKLDFKHNQDILTNVWSVCCVVFDKYASVSYVNSVPVLKNDYGPNHIKSLRIGTKYNLTNYLTGYIGEILIFGDVMTDTDRILVDGWLRQKWGI